MHWRDLSILMAKVLPLVGLATIAGTGFIAVRRRQLESRKARLALRTTIKNELHVPATLHPQIDPALCAGCGACVRVCPEGDILQMLDHKAVLTQPTKCVGHGECEAACPFSAISLVFGTKTRGMELPRVTGNYETNVPGLYIAGELGGMGLIRNAVRQGRLAAEHALKSIPAGAPLADCDLVIVGAGAAGLSAALAAVAAGKSYFCIEQGSLGGTVFNFPRQKVVMSQPADLPVVGLMKFPSQRVSKEDLLGYWNRIRKKMRLKIMENTRFISLQKDDDGRFHVETSKGRLTARKVILAMGVRGTPRKLGLPNEDLPKVTYNLIEPDQYRGMDVAVVGGGNAAAEAARMLAEPSLRNRVTILVRGAAFSRCNQENQEAVERLAQEGRLRIAFKTQVADIQPKIITVTTDGRPQDLKNDFLFIFAGADLPTGFLKSLGIIIEKKFGEARRRP